MKSFQRKRGWSNIMQSRPVLVFLVILLCFFAWGTVGFMGKMIITSENRKIAEDQLRELEQKKAKLTADITKLNTQSGVEESIRLKFGLAKDGESVIVVVPDKTQPEVKLVQSSGFFSFFENLFK